MISSNIEIKLEKNVFKFKEKLNQAEDNYFISSVSVNFQGVKLKIKISGLDHNPPHVRIVFNDYIDEEFRFKIETGEFYKNDILKNESYKKFKSNKLYYAVLEYLKVRKKILTDSFYTLNPTLKSDTNDTDN